MMPTPADLARRTPPPPPPAELAAPALSEPFRGAYQRAIRHSALPPAQRLVALVLATYADQDGTIPHRDQPGIKRIAHATGLSSLVVRESMRFLAQLGWIERAKGTRQPPPGQALDVIPVTLTIPPYARTRLGLPAEGGTPAS